MNLRSYLFVALLGLGVLSSCKKDEEVPPPSVTMSVTDQELNGKVGVKMTFAANTANASVAYQQSWSLDGEVVLSDAGAYEFTPAKAGVYRIEYNAVNEGGKFQYAYTVNVGVPVVPTTPESNAYVSTLFEYTPAPGQFINKSPGDMVSAESILTKQGLVTLGAWGGSIVLGFDHTVLNEPEKDDIVIYGNASATFAEPGIVWVMQDENGNGKPDDTWYEVAGSEFGKVGYKRNYSVTYTRPVPDTEPIPWKDSDGNTGVVATNTYHKQSYFPAWVTGNEYTLTGSLLPSSNIVKGTFVTSAPFAWGYADNLSGDNAIDIANAVDKDGNKVSLSGVDFIKIQTGVQANMGLLGEFSTEVKGVADLSLLKK